MAKTRHKLDPKLRTLHEDDFDEHGTFNFQRSKGENLPKIFVDVFVEVANFAGAQWLQAQVGVKHVVHLVDGYYTAKIRADRVGEVAAYKDIVVVEAVRFVRGFLNQSIDAINGRVKRGAHAPNEGDGVIVGIVDYDLDVTLMDFCNPQKAAEKQKQSAPTTRVAYFWHQALTPQPGETMPAKYRYGVEFTKPDIDAALRVGDFERLRPRGLFLEETLTGHGTHVAGIAAGNGQTSDATFPAGDYQGVAPGATLVFVNLSRADVVLQAQSPRGTMANSVNLMHAITYCFDKADELGMPCVVNLSLGFNGGGHDGNMAVEWIMDTLLQRPGRAVVIAAGNEDQNSIHARRLVKTGDAVDLVWMIGDEEHDDKDPNELEVWYPRGGRVDVWVTAPDDQKSRKVQPDKHDGDPFAFAAGERLRIASDSMTAWNGDARIHILLDMGQRAEGVRRGAWKVHLDVVHAVPAGPKDPRMQIDAWIERTVGTAVSPGAQSRFVSSPEDHVSTLTTPATGRLTITVASQLNDGTRLAQLAASSGRGPTRDGRYKPELSAPGELVRSSNADAGMPDGRGEPRPARVQMGGTSMAAPHVTGVVARMLSRNAYLRAKDILKILIETAARPENLLPAPGQKWPWDPKRGYGTVDADKAVKRVEQLVGTTPPDA